MNEAIPLALATLLAAVVAWLSISSARRAIDSQPRQKVEMLREKPDMEPGVPQEYSILVEEVRASLASRAYFSRVIAKKARRTLSARRTEMPDDRLPPGLQKLLAAERTAETGPGQGPRTRQERVPPRELEAIITELEEL